MRTSLGLGLLLVLVGCSVEPSQQPFFGNAPAPGPGAIPADLLFTDSASAPPDLLLTDMAEVPPSLTPVNGTSVTPGGTLHFTISNGTPGYVASVVTGSTGSGQTLVISGTDVAFKTGATGSTMVQLIVTDSLNVASQPVSVMVNPPLVASAPPGSVVPGGTEVITAQGGDGNYTWSFTTNNSGTGAGISTTTGGSTTYTAGTMTTDVTDVVTLTDGSGGSKLVNISVGHDALAITQGNVTVAPKGTTSFTATGGPANTTRMWSIISTPMNGSINSSSGQYTAGPGSASAMLQDTVQVMAGTETATVTVTIGPQLSISVPQSPVPGGTTETLIATGGSGTLASVSFMAMNTGSMAKPATASIATSSTITYKAGHIPNATDTLLVTDSNGNTAQVMIMTGAGITISPSATPTSPPKGTLNFSATGGSGTGFVWTPAITTSGGTVTDLGNGHATYVAGTNPGPDTVTVTDDLGNTRSATVTIGPGVSFTQSESTSAPMGMFTFTAKGGSGGITFTLDPSDMHPSGGSIGLSSGAYIAGPTGNTSDTVIATDTLGNVAKQTVSVGGGITIQLGSPTTFPKALTTLAATGGSGSSYVFSVASPAHGTIVTHATNASCAATCYLAGAGSTGNLTDTIDVVDSLTNTSSTTIVISPAISVAPASLSIAPLGHPTLSASGGNGTFMWSNATSATGALTSTTGSSNTYTAGSAAGTDTITVADSLGNTATVPVTVTAALTLSESKSSVAPLGSATFTAANGNTTGGYTYSFTTKGSMGTIAPQLGVITGTPGSYKAGNKGGAGIVDTVTVTDANGATASKSISITAGVTITPQPAATAPGGTLSFTASGGSGTGFTWLVTVKGSLTPTIDASGPTVTYTAGSKSGTSIVDTIQATDSLGNIATANIAVGGIAIAPATPETAPHGTINFTVAGGTGTGFKWKLAPSASGGSINSSTGVYIAGAVGNVNDTVVVTDSGGNSSQVLAAVGPPVSITPTTMALQAGKTQSFSVTGGSGSGYVWSFSTNATGATITADGAYTAGAVAGEDIVQVVDSLGSAAVAVVTVTVPVVETPDMGTSDMAKAPDDMAQAGPDDGVPGDAAVATKSKGSGCDLGGAGSASPLALILGATMIVLLRRRRLATQR